MDMLNTNIDPRDLKCPITLLYFRNPVIAQDGYIYEKEAIDQWFSEHKISPMTNLPINTVTLPCHFIKNLIDQIEKESKDPFFYMERYNHGIRNWLKHCVKKSGIVLTQDQHNIINLIPCKIPESEKLSDALILIEHETPCSSNMRSNNVHKHSFKSLFDSMKINDNIYSCINLCRMPDRKILYHYLVTHTEKGMEPENVKKIIDSTSPDDHGLWDYLDYVHVDHNESLNEHIDQNESLNDGQLLLLILILLLLFCIVDHQYNVSIKDEHH
jgi:hypothetical protein